MEIISILIFVKFRIDKDKKWTSIRCGGNYPFPTLSESLPRILHVVCLLPHESLMINREIVLGYQTQMPSNDAFSTVVGEDQEEDRLFFFIDEKVEVVPIERRASFFRLKNCRRSNSEAKSEKILFLLHRQDFLNI